MTSTAPRIGVLRSGNASSDPVVALVEARVVRHELVRRLGDVSVDFRTNGVPHPPWTDHAHAAWPSDVDAVVDLDEVVGLVGDGDASIASLFARTLDTDAVDVRRRMLTHLGVLPVDRVDDDVLAERLPAPRRPTDVWLLLHDADEVTVSDPDLRTLVEHDAGDVAKIDEWFDRQVDGFDVDAAPMIERLQERVDDLRSQLAEARSEMARAERLAVERLDELAAEGDTLRERLERTLLDTELS